MTTKTRTAHDLPTIKVFEESPLFDSVAKYWMLSDDILRKLYVTTWTRQTDEDGEPVNSEEEDASYVRSRYNRPVVLVY